MKCGHCKGDHETVTQVRKCAGIKETGNTKTRSLPRSRATEGDDADLTLKQQKFLSDLLAEFGLELQGAHDGMNPATIDYQSGKRILDGLVDARRFKATGRSFTLPAGVRQLAHPEQGKPRERTVTRQPMPDVPAGHYAVPAALLGYEVNDLYFYRVDRPTEGPFRGRTYVKAIVGGHPDHRVNYKASVKALEAILKFGVEDAGILYGTQLGRCRKCNRHLTDELSRALGIGPECRSRAS
jgi:uncharacterized protein DUF6011